MGKEKTTEARRWAALAFMLTAQTFSALMNVSIRLLETRRSQLGPLQILSVRMVLTAILLFFYLSRSGIPNSLLGPKEVRGFLVIRALGGFIGVFSLYYSLAHLKLSEATAITFLTPFCTSALCYLLLGETVTLIELGALIVSFAGVLIITRPSLSIFPQELFSIAWKKQTEEGATGPAERNLAVFVAFIGVLSSAGALTAVRRVGTTAHPLTSVNYFVLCSAILSIFALLILPGQKIFVTSLHTQEWGLLFAAGLFGLLMVRDSSFGTFITLESGVNFPKQVSMTLSLQIDKASRATSMMFMQLVFAIGLDKIVFGLDPDVFEFSGVLLILLTATFVGLRVPKAPKNASRV